MGLLENAVQEFKDMPKGAKIAFGVGAIGVAGLALYLRSRQGAQTQAPQVSAGDSAPGFQGLTGTDTSGNNAAGPVTTPPGGTDSGGTTPPPPTTTPPPVTQPPILTPPPVKKPPPPPKVTTYVVQGGDSLSAIAGKLGVKGGWQALYNANKSTIDSTARAHGFSSSLYNWIFPGEKLNLSGLI